MKMSYMHLFVASLWLMNIGTNASSLSSTFHDGDVSTKLLIMVMFLAFSFLAVLNIVQGIEERAKERAIAEAERDAKV